MSSHKTPPPNDSSWSKDNNNNKEESKPMPQSKEDDTTKRIKQDPPPAAATVQWNRSPTLIPAVSSRFPTPLSPRHEFFGWLLALLSPSLFYLGPFLILSPPLLYFVSPRACFTILLLDCLLLVYPHTPWPAFRSSYQLWYQRYNLHHNLLLESSTKNSTGDKDDDQSSRCPTARMNHSIENDMLAIHAMHPHGVIPIQTFLWMTFCDQYLPNLYGFGATTDMAMRTPLLRQIMLWGSSGPATKTIVQSKLEAGHNLYVLPGGVAEIFLAQPKTHRIKALRRGLMKLALQTGAALVPIYVFGGNDFFSQWPLTTEHFSRSARAGITLFWGQWFSPLPHAVPQCTMVLGDPIFPTSPGQETAGTRRTCRKIPHPTEQEIQDLLQRYTTALQRLFDQYKAQAGYPNAQLEIR